jgi:hypothetical protein
VSIQTLAVPLDVTWQRLAYSRDMIDTSFGDAAMPPKWRSSMAVYSYVVPEEQTADSYPNARIVYLRLTCSITGWNPSEDLANAATLSGALDKADDLQTSLWEVIQSDGWASTYWPCLGAIAQIAVYPAAADGAVAPDDFPHILDFEPKKRELYETRSDTGEVVSGSSSKLNVQKGATTTSSSEESDILTGLGASATVGPYGGSASISGEWGTRSKTGTQAVEVTNTDASRERRETTSFSTTVNQMYQLFNGYHLGTNRAVFYVEPRPHVVDSSNQTNANVIRGQRRLEGLQDVFLVVHVPRQLSGLCVQAMLDTAHRAMFTNGVAYAIALDDETSDADPSTSGGGGHLPVLGGALPPDFPEQNAPDNVVYRLVVTRRGLRNCGRFDTEPDRLTPTGDPTPPVDGGAGASQELPLVVYESVAPGPTPTLEASLLRSPGKQKEVQFSLADQMNRFQHEITSGMLSGFSAGRYTPRAFVQTETFRRLIGLSLRQVATNLADVVGAGLLQADLAQELDRAGVRTIADLFGREATSARGVDPQHVTTARRAIVKALLAPAAPGNA